MFLFKFDGISKKLSSKSFKITFFAVLTLILAVTLHSLTRASFAIINPNSVINQSIPPQELIAQSQTATSEEISPKTPPNIATENTALLFENDRYAVRVFREKNKAYLNVYDQGNKTVIVKKVAVAITPAKNPSKDPIKYIATVGNQQYIVIISPSGTSELTIIKAGTVIYRNGTNTVEIAQKIPGVSDQAVLVNPTVALIKTLFINYAKLTLFALMFSMAIRWTFQDVIWLWQKPALLLRSLFSVLIIVPVLGVLIALMPGLTVAQRIGIGAMIACPGAPMIPFKSLKVGGEPKFVASLQFTVCILAIFSIPLTAFILAQFYPNEAWLSPQDIAQQILFSQVLPMGIGVLIGQYLPTLANDLVEPATKIAKLMLLLAVIIILSLSLEKVLNAGFSAYLAIGLLSIASLVCGHILGGKKPENQTVLAYATATRNAGLAILLVSVNFPKLDFIERGIINTVITYAIIAGVVSIPYTAWHKRQPTNSTTF
ncbi:bile acid:sodium symporter family protein [Planktothrix sp.]|uniref:bile acid:sodium symporter family protein n=1 Tax=Planktothrix sp. TaxID=3088171 RepID=UPI0038D4FA04